MAATVAATTLGNRAEREREREEFILASLK
jgi:hypothetical protein